MTLSEAKHLHHGQTIYHKRVKNADGTPARARVTGKVKTWKRDPSKVRVPLKRGLYEYLYLDEYNAGEFTTDEEEAK